MTQAIECRACHIRRDIGDGIVRAGTHPYELPAQEGPGGLRPARVLLLCCAHLDWATNPEFIPIAVDHDEDGVVRWSRPQTGRAARWCGRCGGVKDAMNWLRQSSDYEEVMEMRCICAAVGEESDA